MHSGSERVKGVNHRYWSQLVCSERGTFLGVKVSFQVASEEIILKMQSHCVGVVILLERKSVYIYFVGGGIL